MTKSIKDNPKKKRGRPATGKAPLVGVRMTEEFQATIKTWAKKQSDDPPLAAAIRRLVEIGLHAGPSVLPGRRAPSVPDPIKEKADRAAARAKALKAKK